MFNVAEAQKASDAICKEIETLDQSFGFRHDRRQFIEFCRESLMSATGSFAYMKEGYPVYAAGISKLHITSDGSVQVMTKPGVHPSSKGELNERLSRAVRNVPGLHRR